MPYIDINCNVYAETEPEAVTEARAQQVRESMDALVNSGRPFIPNSVFASNLFPLEDFHKSVNDVMADRKGHHEMVFVWDIEEITLLPSHYIEHITRLFPALQIRLLNTMLERILINANFWTPLASRKDSLINIEDAIHDGSHFMSVLAPKYNALRQFYNKISDGMREDGPIINYELVKKCAMVGEVVDLYIAAERIQKKYEHRWKKVRQCLELINEKYTNIVICGDKLGHGIGQLLISGHSKQVKIDNVFSTCNKSKEVVFQRIQKRFDDKVLVYITSSKNNASIAKKLNIPVLERTGKEHTTHLYNALKDVLLR